MTQSIFENFRLSLSLSLYVYNTTKPQISVKSDLGEFYKKLYSHFNLPEHQIILKTLNVDILSAWAIQTSTPTLGINSYHQALTHKQVMKTQLHFVSFKYYVPKLEIHS